MMGDDMTALNEVCSLAVVLIVEIYRRHSCGGALHIMLDDGNLNDHTIQFCWDWMSENPPEDKVLRGLERTILAIYESLPYKDRVTLQYAAGLPVPEPGEGVT